MKRKRERKRGREGGKTNRKGRGRIERREKRQGGTQADKREEMKKDGWMVGMESRGMREETKRR